jgi:hypothetical protein
MKNMGALDKSVRVAIALGVGGLYITGMISGTLAIILLIIAVIFVITSFISFCPIYLPFGISTRPKK